MFDLINADQVYLDSTLTGWAIEEARTLPYTPACKLPIIEVWGLRNASQVYLNNHLTGWEPNAYFINNENEYGLACKLSSITDIG